MKKLFTILCVLLIGLSISAQTQFGGVLGLNIASVSGSDTQDLLGDVDSRLGIRIGLSFSKELSDVVTLNSGVVYSVKGTSYQAYELFDDGFGNLYWAGTYLDADISLNYIELPVNFAFSVADQFALMAGFYSAFLVGVTNTVGGQDMGADTDGWTTIDVGIGVGAQFSINDAISIDAGYQMGVIPLDEDGSFNSKNSNILIGMTYNFGGGRY